LPPGIDPRLDPYGNDSAATYFLRAAETVGDDPRTHEQLIQWLLGLAADLLPNRMVAAM
jgi:hypothetical protein